MAQIFFIVGRGRSATALLARTLARHPNIAVAPEGLFVLDLHSKYGAGRWTRKRIAAFVRDLGRHRGVRSWGLSTQRLSARLYERESRLDYAEVCRQVYTSQAEDTLGRSDIAWVGDRNPSHALQIERLERIFPQARYLHITRDYRDEVFEQSLHARAAKRAIGPAGDQLRLRRAWGRLWSLLPWQAGLTHPAAVAQRWKEYNRRILRLSRSAPERALWLRYEDLLAYPEHELTRICSFLDVPFDAPLMALEAAEASVAEAVLAKAARPIEQVPAPSGSAGRRRDQEWQQLPDPTLRQVEAICGEFAERFGYRSTARQGGGLSLPIRVLTWYGASSVAVERLAVGALPARLRMRLRDAYLELLVSLRAENPRGEVTP